MSVWQALTPSDTVVEKIESLERVDLANARSLDYSFNSSADRSYLTMQNFVQIRGMSAFWEKSRGKKSMKLEQSVEDFIAGLYGLRIPFCYIVTGQGNMSSVYFGLSRGHDDSGSMLKGGLEASFPDIRLRTCSVQQVCKHIDSLGLGCVATGIPTGKMGDGETIAEQIERLIRGMFGGSWAYVVIAEPIDEIFVSDFFITLAEEIKKIQSTILLKGTVDEGNRLAAHYVEILELTLERFKIGKSAGMWAVRTYLLASSEILLAKGMTLLGAVFSGKDSRPQPLRTHIFNMTQSTGGNAGVSFKRITTLLNSRELSILARLPQEEMPGYEIADYSRFGVSLPDESVEKQIPVGYVVDRGIRTGGWFELSPADFAKHSMIVGVTGSGKTNTSFHILDSLWRSCQVPFLVIEPAKCEYRDLRQVNGFEALKIFTLGDETVAPFRLNPFEVQQGVHVQTHIDHLKSVFFASFVLYAPMPYVLEQSIHEIYEDRGWELAGNRNVRGTGTYSFPTLTDLYYKIAEVVEKLGYSETVSRDVMAGLKMRINSLRIGGKGMMLDTRSSIPMEYLLSSPTIMELKQIGDDDEKAFLIGLILIRLYEYYEALLRLGRLSCSNELRHVTLVEEAHRLFRNVPMGKISEDSSNIKGKAVETFCNILSEIRAYGEGIIIADQIPTKLFPDAVKNTNLKIMHRIVAADDREVMAGAMNMDDDQRRKVTTLKTGSAVAYAEGVEKPYLINITPYKERCIKAKITDNEVSSYMLNGADRAYAELLHRFNGCRLCHPSDECESIRNKSLNAIRGRGFSESFSRFFLSLLVDEALLTPACATLKAIIIETVNPQDEEEFRRIFYCSMLQEASLSFEERCSYYGSGFEDICKLEGRFATLLQAIVSGADTLHRADFHQLVSALATDVREAYIKVSAKKRGRFTGCTFCNQRCLYYVDVMHILSHPLICETERSNDLLIRNPEYYLEAAKAYAPTGDEKSTRAIALCLAAQKMSQEEIDQAACCAVAELLSK